MAIVKQLKHNAINPIGMKNLLLLFLLPFFCYGQSGQVVGPGEYDCYFINSSGKWYHLSSSLPVAFSVPSNLTFTAVAGGLHNGAAIDNSGNVWTAGDNSAGVAGNGSTAGTSNPSQVLTDSAGHVFDSVVQVALWYSTGTGVVAVKSTGTLWIWGNLAGNMRGNGVSAGTWTRPVQVIIPGNRKVTKVCVDDIMEVLCSDGTVWTWGGANSAILGANNTDCTTPHQVVLPQAAKDIAGGSLWSYAVGTNGALYGWGWYGTAMFGTYGPSITTPVDLTKYMGFTLPVSKAFVNTVASYFILSDGSLWSCGDNLVGSLGNGQQGNQATSATPYAVWTDPSATGQLLQPVPTRILPGVQFTNVFVGTADVFYFYAQDSKGQLYSAGRNKGGVLGNGVRECDYMAGLIGSQYPNSWDVPTLTAVNPLSLTAATSQTSPICSTGNNQSISPCNLCASSIIQVAAQAIPGKILATSASDSSGVLAQITTDLGGGLNLGWIDLGDWMDYNVNVAAAGTYTVSFRVATPNSGASFQLRTSAGTVLATMSVPSTGNFQTWETISTKVVLPAGVQVLQIYSDAAPEWNINWMQFVSAASAPSVVAQAIPGKIEAESTFDSSGVAAQPTTDVGGGLNVGWIDLGDWMDYEVNVATAGTYTVSFRVATPNSGAGFQLRTSTGTVLATMSVTPTGGFQTWETISTTVVLLAGVQVLQIYSDAVPEWNINWMQFVSAGSAPSAVAQAIPGKIEAVSTSDSSGVAAQPTSDVGGGMNVGWIDLGDWMDYNVDVAAAGTYTVSFRVATPNTGASFQLRTSTGTVLATMNVKPTGSFQAWQTISTTVVLPAGVQVLQVYSTAVPEWNFNWMQFVSGTTTAQATISAVSGQAAVDMDTTAGVSPSPASITLYPNPVRSAFTIVLNNGYTGDFQVVMTDAAGAVKHLYYFTKSQQISQIDLSAADLPAGIYFVRLQGRGWSEIRKIIKL